MAVVTPAGAVTSPPFRLLIPANWEHVPLADPARRRAGVARLVSLLGEGLDLPERWRLREQLDGAAQASADTGGLDLYLWAQHTGRVPLAVTLTTSLLPAAAMAWDVDVVADSWRADHDPGSVTVVDLPGGRAARRASWRSEGSGEHTVRCLVVEHVLAVPNSTSALLLTGTSPLAPLAAEVAELFDALVRTVTWRP